MEETTFSFTLYGADCRGNAKNILYPHRYEIHNLEDFLKMADRDFVCAEYANNWRSSVNFIGADYICMDCDNTHSDNPIDWKTPEDVKATFPEVPFIVHYSRNHMKVKDGKELRPKYAYRACQERQDIQPDEGEDDNRLSPIRPQCPG